MQKAFLSSVVLVALALAGCGEEHDAVQPVTCPDGTVLSVEDIEGNPDHHAEGFDPAKGCPVKPSVTLVGVPATLPAFKAGAFSWTLDNGTFEHAHSMLTAIRYSESSVPDAELTATTKYPTELIKREHQDLPITYKGNMTFSKVGKVYLRAYMEVAGKDYWSPEVVLEVTPVVPTGKVVDFTQGMGDFAAPVAPTEQIVVLGDAVRLVNDDVREHTCTWASGPVQVGPLVAAANGGASEAFVMEVPGTYEFTCDDLQEHGFKVIVNA
jgi:plastocyanin